MALYVLNQSFSVVGIIDEYESLIWRPAYYNVGDFELYISATQEYINLLKKDYYLVRTSDITVENGITTYTKVMIIKNFKLTTDIDAGDHYIVTGKELKYILHQRIIWSQTNLTGTAENAIRTLVNQNAINPSDTKRKIPNLVLGSAAGLTDSIEKQLTGDKLDEAISEICATYNYGWDIFIYNNSLVFVIYKGLDRSYSQTARPYVVFSDEFDNILNSEYELKSESYANCTLIGGEGEGTNRVYTSIGNDKSGLERFEMFTDARDVSSNNGAITRDAYLQLLRERGSGKLAEIITEGFTGEVISDLTFKYDEDFFIGDVVTVINKYGISKDVRVLSAIESDDSNGSKLIPQFNL